MQQEKDYIKREVEKIVLFVKRIVEQLAGSYEGKEDSLYSEEFTSAFNFQLTEFIRLNNKDFIEHTKNLNSKILEELINLFLELTKKEGFEDKKQSAEKALILLEIFEEKEKTFSLERMQLKASLLSFLK